MAATLHLLLVVALPLFLVGNQVDGVGINYGTVGNNLPSPKKVAQMLQTTLIDKVKIYNTDPSILQAFSNTGIDIVVTLENQQITNISRSQTAAADWFTARIAPFLPATSIVAIAVGNEVLTASAAGAAEITDAATGAALVEAMKNINAVLVEHGLDRKIKISTAHSMAVLSSSFPPSSSTFAEDLVPVIAPMLQFLSDTGAPFMVNAYPYFALRDNPSEVNLEYALLGKAPGVKDPKGFIYTNMLDAQIDAIRSAMSALGFGGNRSIPIIVSESGWPSKGNPGNTAATDDNARIYNTRLIQRAESNLGTPMKPNDKIEVFVFALFNENQKKGGEEERNFGIFNGDGSKVYEMDLSCRFCSGSGNSKEVVGSSPRGGSVWCVAKPHADEGVLQAILDFCCGAGGVDCEEINKGGGCFEPDKLHAHASFAMNAYYHSHGRNYWNCDFKGAGLVTFSDPSFGTCRYPQQ